MKSAGHGAESIWGNHRFGLRRHRITEQGRFMAPVRRQPNCMDTGRIKIGFCLFGRKMKMHARVGGIEGPRNTISQTNLKDRPLPRVCPFFFAAGPQTASANKSVFLSLRGEKYRIMVMWVAMRMHVASDFRKKSALNK